MPCSAVARATSLVSYLTTTATPFGTLPPPPARSVFHPENQPSTDRSCRPGGDFIQDSFTLTMSLSPSVSKSWTLESNFSVSSTFWLLTLAGGTMEEVLFSVPPPQELVAIASSKMKPPSINSLPIPCPPGAELELRFIRNSTSIQKVIKRFL